MLTNSPKIGMLADHKSGELDPRIVTRVAVIDGQEYIYIHLLTREAGPFTAANYDYYEQTPPKKETHHEATGRPGRFLT